MPGWAVVVVAAAVVVSSPVDAGPLQEILAAARAELDAAARQRRVPVPVKLAFKARPRGALNWGAPLLAMAAADVDGDGTDELLLLTAEELRVVAITSRGPILRQSLQLLPGLPVRRPRDAIGEIAVWRGGGGVTVVARSSEREQATEFVAREGRLAARQASLGFPLCAGHGVVLTPGRNYFDSQLLASDAAPITMPAEFWAARCFERAFVAPDGRWVDGFAVVSTDGRLVGSTKPHCFEDKCTDKAETRFEFPRVGAAFTVGDIDNDGHPELALSSIGLGGGDSVRVLTPSGKILFERAFKRGVVAMAIGNFDGAPGRELWVATRRFRDSAFRLWCLNP